MNTDRLSLDDDMDEILALDHLRQTAGTLMERGYEGLAWQVRADKSPQAFEPAPAYCAPEHERNDSASWASVALSLSKSFRVHATGEGARRSVSEQLADALHSREDLLAGLTDEYRPGVPLLEVYRALQVYATDPSTALSEQCFRLYFLTLRELLSVAPPSYSVGSARPQREGHASAFSTSEAVRAVAAFRRAMRRTCSLFNEVGRFFQNLPDESDPLLPREWAKGECKRLALELVVSVKRLAPTLGMNLEYSSKLLEKLVAAKKPANFMSVADKLLTSVLSDTYNTASEAYKAAEKAIDWAREQQVADSTLDPRADMAHRLAIGALEGVSRASSRMASWARVARKPRSAAVAENESINQATGSLVEEIQRLWEKRDGREFADSADSDDSVAAEKLEELRNVLVGLQRSSKMIGRIARNAKVEQIWQATIPCFPPEHVEVAKRVDALCRWVHSDRLSLTELKRAAGARESLGSGLHGLLRKLIREIEGLSKGRRAQAIRRAKNEIIPAVMRLRRRRFAGIHSACERFVHALYHKGRAERGAEEALIRVGKIVELSRKDADLFRSHFLGLAYSGSSAVGVVAALKRLKPRLSSQWGQLVGTRNKELLAGDIELMKWSLSRALVLWKARRLEALEEMRTKLDREALRIDRMLDPGRKFLEGRLEHELALHDSCGTCDHGELVSAAASVAALSRLGSDRRILRAKEILCESLDHDGRFAVVRPVDTARDGFTCIPSPPQLHRSFAQLLEIADSPVESGVVKTLVNYYVRLGIQVGEKWIGWGSEDEIIGQEASRWRTSIALLALDRVYRMLETRVNARVLKHFSVEYPAQSPAPQLGDLIYGDFGYSAYKGYESVSVMAIRAVAHIWGVSVPDQAPPRWNAVLYGPPGTGKTTIPSSIGKTAGVPVVELTPSDITLSGESHIERRARTVFQALACLTRVVIVLDEFDPVLKSRRLTTESQQNAYSFLTPGMLPKLKSLHDRSKRNRSAYFLMTNRIGTLDDAAIRDGRFDVRLPVLPPDTLSRFGQAMRTLRQQESSEKGAELPASCDSAFTEFALRLLRVVLFMNLGSINEMRNSTWLGANLDKISGKPLAPAEGSALSFVLGGTIDPTEGESFATDFSRLYGIDGLDGKANRYGKDELDALSFALAVDLCLEGFLNTQERIDWIPSLVEQLGTDYFEHDGGIVKAFRELRTTKGDSFNGASNRPDPIDLLRTIESVCIRPNQRVMNVLEVILKAAPNQPVIAASGPLSEQIRLALRMPLKQTINTTSSAATSGETTRGA